MTRLRVHCFTVSLDGFGAGPAQDFENPIGVGGLALHQWIFPTRTFRQMEGGAGGEHGVDDDFVARGNEGIGAWILGRNMFGLHARRSPRPLGVGRAALGADALAGRGARPGLTVWSASCSCSRS